MKPKLSQEAIEELDALLPWYVNGTLEQEDQVRIATTLGQNERLQASLAVAREDAEAVAEAAARLGAPSHAALDRIMTATAPSAIVTASANLLERFRAFIISLSPQSLALAGTATALLIVVQGVSLGWLALDGEDSAGPELASVNQSANSSDGILIVKFAEGASVSDVGMVLQQLDLVIVDGPTGDGLFVIGYRVDAASKQGAAELAKQLLANSRITQFAAPMAAP